MSIFRSYFNNNASIIKNSVLNNSRNPVMQLVYGDIGIYSRYIFDIDLTSLTNNITNNGILSGSVLSHKIKFTNTISFDKELIGGQFSDGSKRANSFDLVLFNIGETFDNGSGYDFIPLTGETFFDNNFNTSAPNWYYKKTGVLWSQPGTYTGNTPSSAITSQHFIDGNEDIVFDISNQINGILYSGQTNNRFGIAFSGSIETLTADTLYGVAFFSPYTNTFYQPYLETTINDTIIDDRNFFYLDKNNNIYFYSNVGGKFTDPDSISKVEIFDYEGILYQTFTGTSINKLKKGIYYVSLNVPSDTYPDLVLFTDKWSFIYSGKTKTVENEFALLNPDNYFDFSNGATNDYETDYKNFFFSYSGIRNEEVITNGEIRKIIINVRRLYGQHNNIPLDLEYRIYVREGTDEVDVVPFTLVSRDYANYFFNMDTSWFIQHDYYLDVKMTINGISKTLNNVLSFIVK
jgi:hypothetical protein